MPSTRPLHLFHDPPNLRLADRPYPKHLRPLSRNQVAQRRYVTHYEPR